MPRSARSRTPAAKGILDKPTLGVNEARPSRPKILRRKFETPVGKVPPKGIGDVFHIHSRHTSVQGALDERAIHQGVADSPVRIPITAPDEQNPSAILGRRLAWARYHLCKRA